MENQSIRHKKDKHEIEDHEISSHEINISKIKKRDIIFLGILGAAATAFLICFLLGYRDKGRMVEITVNGELYGSYSLDEEQKIPIETEGSITNVLVIKDGKADMTRADCPDKLCVHQTAVSNAGETIVCLPNKVVVTVIGSKE